MDRPHASFSRLGRPSRIVTTLSLVGASRLGAILSMDPVFLLKGHAFTIHKTVID